MTMHSLLAGAYVSSAAWTPTGISPTIWLDPSDLSTMWQDSARTTAVTADGDPVGSIQNKGSVSCYFIQDRSSARPTYKTSGGLHWLEFDGVDDYLYAQQSDGTTSVAISNAVTASTYEAVAGARCDTVPTIGSFAGWYAPGVWGDEFGYMSVATFVDTGGGDLIQGYNYSNVGDYDEHVQIAYTQSSDVVASQRHESDTLYLSKDGGSFSSIAAYDTSLLSGIMLLGYCYSTFPFYDGRIYGLIVKDATFSADRSSAITWMGNKCGLSI